MNQSKHPIIEDVASPVQGSESDLSDVSGSESPHHLRAKEALCNAPRTPNSLNCTQEQRRRVDKLLNAGAEDGDFPPVLDGDSEAAEAWQIIVLLLLVSFHFSGP